MPAICDTIENWGEMDADERLEFLKDFINEYLGDEGYGPVNVTSGPDTEDRYGSWSESTNTVNIDDSHLANDSAEDSINTAVHEAAHAEHDFENPDEEEPADYDDTYEKYTMVFDDDGNPVVYEPGDPVNADHRDIYYYAQDLVEMIFDACEEGPGPESGAQENLPPGDWVTPDANATTAYA